MSRVTVSVKQKKSEYKWKVPEVDLERAVEIFLYHAPWLDSEEIEDLRGSKKELAPAVEVVLNKRFKEFLEEAIESEVTALAKKRGYL